MGIKLGKKIWQDDDAARHTRGYEGLHKIYQDLFGRKYSQKNSLVKEDGGDAFVHLMPNGIGVVHAYDGDSIYLFCREEN